ncbi:MAG: VWA domain-containing protein [Gammaproteobacteria bacterium]|jgi:hypothetical protein
MKKICLVLLLTLVGLSGCSKFSSQYNQGVYMLVDTSGTYTKELSQAKKIINFILAKLNPGDTFAVAQVNTGSFTQKDIIDKRTFDDRPSMANDQKREFSKVVDKFIKKVRPSAYTDITGGLLQAIEFLNEANTNRKIILIFSDLKEDLRPGYVRNIPLKLKGFEVIAVNVTKLHSDNVDPREYMKRLSDWKRKVVKGGGSWRVINDMQHLDPIFQ